MTKVKTKIKTKPRTNPGTVQTNKGDIVAPTPKGPNQELLPSVTFDIEPAERQVIVQMIERLKPIGIRTALENRLLAKANNRRKNEIAIEVAEAITIHHCIDTVTV